MKYIARISKYSPINIFTGCHAISHDLTCIVCLKKGEGQTQWPNADLTTNTGFKRITVGEYNRREIVFCDNHRDSEIRKALKKFI